MEGTVEKISTKTGQTNGKNWILYSVQIDGINYGTFSKSLIESLKEGDKVIFGYEEKGENRNLTNIKQIEIKVETVKPVDDSHSNYNSFERELDQRQKDMRLMNAANALSVLYSRNPPLNKEGQPEVLIPEAFAKMCKSFVKELYKHD